VFAVDWSDVSNVTVPKTRARDPNLLAVDFSVLRDIFGFLMPVGSHKCKRSNVNYDFYIFLFSNCGTMILFLDAEKNVFLSYLGRVQVSHRCEQGN